MEPLALTYAGSSVIFALVCEEQEPLLSLHCPFCQYPWFCALNVSPFVASLIFFPFLSLSYNDSSPVLRRTGGAPAFHSSLLCGTKLSKWDPFLLPWPPTPTNARHAILSLLSCQGDLRLSRRPGSASSQLCTRGHGVIPVCTSQGHGSGHMNWWPKCTAQCPAHIRYLSVRTCKVSS